MSSRQVWLGHARAGGRFAVKLDAVKDGIAILGAGANELASVAAYACKEAGLRTLVLDIDGTISDSLSGYIEEYSAAQFLYDVMRIEDYSSKHAQLVAGAYASSLDLSFEQEASLNSITQIIAAEEGVASPSSLSDLIQSPDSTKGRAVDRLRARLESLRSLNLVGETGVAKKILEGSAILNLRDAGSPEALETAAALTIAKLLALADSHSFSKPDVVVVTDANRLFKARPVFRKSQRFLTSFVSAPLRKVLASEASYGLDESYLDTCSTLILSSAVANEAGGRMEPLVLTPNMFMFQNKLFGHKEVFIPRTFERKKGAKASQDPQPAVGDNPGISARVLEEVAAFHGATRASIIAFLSSEFQKDELERTLDKLQSEGYLSTNSEERQGSGRTMHTLSVTDKGRSFLGSQPR